jgi:hypothetical protein
MQDQICRICCWTEAESIRDIESVRPLRYHLHDLIAYLKADRSALERIALDWNRGTPRRGSPNMSAGAPIVFAGTKARNDPGVPESARQNNASVCSVRLNTL